MGHVEKRGPNRWRARWRGPDGREHSRTFRRRLDADNWLRDIQSARDRGLWVDPAHGKITFAEWTDQWFRNATGLRPGTRVLYEGIIDNHLKPRFGDWPLSAITRQAVKEMVVEDEGRWSVAVLRQHVTLLATILTAAVEEGRIAQNPAARIRSGESVQRDMRFLTAEELMRLAESINPHYRTLVLTAGWMGLRFGELAGLGVEHVDLLRRRLRIDRQLTEVRGKVTFGPPKTKASVRTLSVPAALGVELEQQIGRDVVQSSGLVFPTVNGNPLHRANFRLIWLAGCREAGLERLRFHDLRHTAAALAIEAGAHPLVVKERLGHSSITVTMDVYGGLFPRVDELLAEALDARIETSRGLTAASDVVELGRNVP